MAPSPELGQPKAPDKTPPSATLTGGGNIQNDSVLTNNNNNINNNSNNNQANSNHTQVVSPNTSKITTATPQTTTTTTISTFPTSQSMTTSSTASSGSANTFGVSSTILNTNTSANASNSSNSIEMNTKNLGHWDDSQFKSLLDEAYSYKNPKDIEHKSETFRKLLQTAERKEEESAFSRRALTSKYTCVSNGHKHGGSLQDLIEAAYNDFLDGDYSYGNRNRRHHHNSRPKKYSSVSSRQREGGSLPSNVNASNCNLSVCEQPFLNEVNKRRSKNERTCSGTSCASGTSGTSSTVSTCGHDSLNSGQLKDDSHTNSSGDTIIDINDSFLDESQHLLAHDTLAQGISENKDSEDGIELTTVNKFTRITMNSATTGKLELIHQEPKHYVDETVAFPTLERVKNVDPTYLPLDENCKAYKSILGDKAADIPKPAIFSTTKTNTKHFDENGNSLNSPYNSSQSQAKAKKKKSQSEKNTTTINVKLFAGYRGEDTVEELLKFIENTDSKKNDKNMNSNKKKEKKKERDKDKDVKKEVHKVKKSNSLEELRSCTKLDEDEKSENPVTMRSKGKKSNTNSSLTANDSRENIKQQNAKRGERRSWGTEELTYLGENNAIEEVREKAKEKEKTKKPKDTSEKHEKSENNKKKKEDTSLNSTFTESVQCESAEFHVVTKKKKAKKRQQMDEARPPGNGKTVSIKDSPPNVNSLTNSSNTAHNKKYQTSSNFTNDRDVYLNSLTVNEPRRKSTSSVPPSEKSDSSDLDSVHSLPVESTSNRHHNSGNLITTTATVVSSSATVVSVSNACPQSQPQSYADIARTVNANKYLNSINSPPMDKMDKWPTVSSYSITNPNGSNNSSSVLTALALSSTNEIILKNSKKALHRDFPDLVSDKSNNNNNNDAGSSCSSTSSTSTIVKQISYSQSLNDEKYNNHGNSINLKSLNTISPKMTDVKSNEVLKQTLQKSKSVENENYYSNIDQYPALEKTVKRHTGAQNSIYEKSTNSVPNNSQFLIIASKQQHQQQRSPSLFTLAPPSISSISSISANTSVQTQTTDSKSKSTTFNNLDIGNTNLNIISSTLSSNPSSASLVGKRTKQQQQLQSNTKTNCSDSTQIFSSVEANNVKNKSPFATIDSFSSTSSNASSKKSKSDATVLQHHQQQQHFQQAMQQQQQQSQSVQQSQIAISNNPHGRKSKKDKNNQNIGTNYTSSASSYRNDSTIMMTSLNTSSHNPNKTSNRPAVIILNDINDSSLSLTNDFTFGDFNEEELRLFDSNHHHHQNQTFQPLDDSGQFNMNQSESDVNAGIIITDYSKQHNDVHHLSPHSDHGYSSSNNRSILSESIDNSTDTAVNTLNTIVNDGNSNQCCSSINNNHRKTTIQQTNVNKYCAKEIATNKATSLGTNLLITPAKTNPSFNNNNNNISNEINYDPCIITVNISSVDNNRTNNSSNTCNNNNNHDNTSKSHQIQQQLVNKISVTSTSSSSLPSASSSNTNNSSNISNNNNNTSGITSNHDNSSLSSSSTTTLLGLENKLNSNSIENANILAATISTTNPQQQQQQTIQNQEQNQQNQLSNISCSVAIVDNAILSTVINSNISSNNNNNNNTTIPTGNNDTSWDNQKKSHKKETSVRFVAPSQEISATNLEKIVDFVGLAWEEVVHRVNRGAQFYNGQ